MAKNINQSLKGFDRSVRDAMQALADMPSSYAKIAGLGKPSKPKRGPKVRVIRVVEYVGDYAAVQSQLDNSIGERVVHNTYGEVVIKATTLGAVPEILNPGETRRLNRKLKAEKVKQKLLDDGKKEPEAGTWMGISRAPGHYQRMVGPDEFK